MDIFKGKRSRNQGGTKHITNSQHITTGQERTQNTLRPFFLHIYRKGKSNNHNTSNTKDQEQEPSRKAGQEQDERRKREDKRRKEENERQNTPQAPKPPNYTRAQKPRKPRKAPNPHKYTSAPQNPLKTALNCEIRHNIGLLQESKYSRGDNGRTKGRNTPRKANGRPSKARPPAPVTSKSRQPTPPHTAPPFKYIFDFRPFRSPKFPRKHQSTPNKF